MTQDSTIQVSFSAKDIKQPILRALVRPIVQKVLEAGHWGYHPIVNFDGVLHLIFTPNTDDAVWNATIRQELEKIGFVPSDVRRPGVAKCHFELNPVSETKAVGYNGVRRAVPAHMRCE